MRLRSTLLPLAFAAFGGLWGAWQATLPQLTRAYELTPGPLGLILTAGFAVSLPVMLWSGRLLDRWGSSRGIALTGILMAVALAGIAALPSFPGLVVAIGVLLVASGAYDVAINGAAMGDASWSRPGRLTLLHAAFSAGGLVCAVGAGALLGVGVGYRAVYPLVAAMLALVAILAVRAHVPRSAGESGVPRGVARAMIPIAILTAIAFLAEGSMETWSAIFLRDELDAVAFVAALGPGAFHGAMLVGRLVGAGIASSLGAQTTMLVAGVMTLAGMTVALLAPGPSLAIPGLAVGALGISFVVPVLVSLAAERAGGYAGRAASYVLSLGYAGFLIGPSLVGIGAELAGLRVALSVVPVAAVVIAIASRSSLVRR